jgi:hypothetical protein
MEDQFKILEEFFTINAISSKLFYCITMWPISNHIDLQGFFNSDLSKILASYTTAESADNGFITFNFYFNSYELKITLT